MDLKNMQYPTAKNWLKQRIIDVGNYVTIKNWSIKKVNVMILSHDLISVKKERKGGQKYMHR